MSVYKSTSNQSNLLVCYDTSGTKSSVSENEAQSGSLINASCVNQALQPIRERPVGPSAFPVIPPLSALRQHSDSNMAVPTAKCLAAYAYLLLISLMFPHVFADSAAGDMPHRRFEYKYSFKGPHLTQSDGRIPFWIHTGSKFIDGCLSVLSQPSVSLSVICQYV